MPERRKPKETEGGRLKMSSEIIIALIGLAGSAAGSLGGVLVSGKLTQYRIEQLERKVEKHNSLIERTYALESKVAALAARTGG